MKFSSLFAIATSFALFAVACGGSEKPEAKSADSASSAAPASSASSAATSPKPDDDGTRGNLSISDAIRKACGISDTEAFFAFDSSNVRNQDKTVLQKLTDCFTTGALKGREMRLVGHADPRGEESYNLALGGQRADNVKRAIVNLGMAAGKVTTTSRGEMDATGTDEESWARDRKVDITLGD